MRRLSVVFFGSGSPAACAALDRLVEVCDVVGVVAPNGDSAAPLRQAAVGHDIPLQQISELSEGVDLFCVATFPRILDSRVLSLPRLGVLNVHPSLLPRHRGPDPLFWTYFDNDSETGVTVHWMTKEVDAGDIVLQTRVPVPRGISGVNLYMDLARVGARLLAQAVVEISDGTALRTHQDESTATTDPSPRKKALQIPYDDWGAERLWHFLRGVLHLGFTPFSAAQSVEDFEIVRHTQPPGTVNRDGSRLVVYASDGRVRLRIRSVRSRVRAWLRRLISNG